MEIQNLFVLVAFISILLAGGLLVLGRTGKAYKTCLGVALACLTSAAFLAQGVVGAACVLGGLLVALPLAVSLLSTATIHLVWAKVRRSYPAEPASPPSAGLSFKEAGRFILGLDR